jgi:hypothetical protein
VRTAVGTARRHLCTQQKGAAEDSTVSLFAFVILTSEHNESVLPVIYAPPRQSVLMERSASAPFHCPVMPDE